MIYYALFAAGWLACSVLGYALLRRAARSDGLIWTTGLRSIALLMSLLGPVALFTGLVFLAFDIIRAKNRPARW